MIMNKIFHLAIMASFALSANATNIKEGLTIWFDRPTTLANKAIWWGTNQKSGKAETNPYQQVIRLKILIPIGNLNLFPLEMAA